MPMITKSMSLQGYLLRNINILLAIPVLSLEGPNHICTRPLQRYSSAMVKLLFPLTIKRLFVVMIESFVIPAAKHILRSVQAVSPTW